MKPNETSSVMAKITKGLGQVKAALTKDYSWQDIKTWMSNRSARTSTVDSVSTASSVSANGSAGTAGSSFASVANLPQALAAAAGRHRMLLIALVCIALFAIASQVWLLPMTKTMQATLELRPVQWAQLQHVLKVNQLISAPGVGGSTAGVGGRRPSRVQLRHHR